MTNTDLKVQERHTVSRPRGSIRIYKLDQSVRAGIDQLSVRAMPDIPKASCQGGFKRLDGGTKDAGNVLNK
jgi:hypothetical protein